MGYFKRLILKSQIFFKKGVKKCIELAERLFRKSENRLERFFKVMFFGSIFLIVAFGY